MNHRVKVTLILKLSFIKTTIRFVNFHSLLAARCDHTYVLYMYENQFYEWPKAEQYAFLDFFGLHV